MLLITVRVVGLPSSVSTLPPRRIQKNYCEAQVMGDKLRRGAPFGVVVLEVDLFNMLPSLSPPLHLCVGLGFAIWAGKRVMQQLPERKHTHTHHTTHKQPVSCAQRERKRNARTWI
jgi:hypothetical protein